MLFNSVQFILVFMPLVVIFFALASRHSVAAVAIWTIVVASLVFYAWEDWRLTGLLLTSILVNYAIGARLQNNRSPLLLTFGIIVNLMALGWFKYLGFISTSLDNVLGLGLDLSTVPLPLAISFFTFQQISYLVDVAKGVAPVRNFSSYIIFVCFFPHLIAGPLLHHAQIIPQFERHDLFRFKPENFAVGAILFCMGLFKKVVLADNAQIYADNVFNLAALGQPTTLVTTWAGAAAFALQVYFDFSGYSDMALGLARVFGIKLPRNFESPYKANSIVEFWTRWHITMTRFFTDYLYTPLALKATRKAMMKRRGRWGVFWAGVAAPTIITFAAAGLWHGAGLTFVVFGLLHGTAITLNHAWRQAKMKALPVPAARILTLLFVTAAFIFFRAPDFAVAMEMVKGLAGLNGVFLPESYGQRLASVAPWLNNMGISFQAPPDVEVYPTRTQLLQIFMLIALTQLLPNTQQIMQRFSPTIDDSPHRTTFWLARVNWQPGAILGFVSASALLVMATFIYVRPQNGFIYFQF